MATEPVLSGDIPPGGVLEILRDIEARRITGKIRFLVGDESGEVELVAGQIAMDQDPLPNGADPVEALLQARSGHFAVHAILPVLPVSQGNDHERRGSLAVHVPADLMTYCEQAGLTGVLEMRNEGRVVEVIYEAGELLGIRLDGREEANLDQVFAWDQGSFRIASRTEEDVRSRLPPPMTDDEPAPPEAPEDPADREPTVRFARAIPDGGATSRYAKMDAHGRPNREDTGRHFLRVVEMALTDVVSVREKARASVRSAPPPKARPSVRPPGRAIRQKDTTVRIVWIGGEPSVETEVPAAARAPIAAPKPASKPSPASKPGPKPDKAPQADDEASSSKDKPSSSKDKPSPGHDKPSSGHDKPSSSHDEPSSNEHEPSRGKAAASSEQEAPARRETTRETTQREVPTQPIAGGESSNVTLAMLIAFLVGLGVVAYFLVR